MSKSQDTISLDGPMKVDHKLPRSIGTGKIDPKIYELLELLDKNFLYCFYIELSKNKHLINYTLPFQKGDTLLHLIIKRENDPFRTRKTKTVKLGKTIATGPFVSSPSPILP